MSILQVVAPTGGVLSLLSTALLLGVRHGIDWDHIAAIADITSTTVAGETGEAHGATRHASQPAHQHADASDAAARIGIGAKAAAPSGRHPVALTRSRFMSEQRRAILLGSLYALGHALVVAILGAMALAFGSLLPDWVDPLMGRVVGLTLIVLGAWVFYSVYAFVRSGAEFRMRSRWMLVFSSALYAWRWLGARLHGRTHVEPVESSSYGPRTAFAVGMVHGVGAETGSQVLIIAAVGGAASIGLGIPMMLAFIVGLLISNSLIVFLTASGFVASRLRHVIYIAVGILAGLFSLVIGALLLFELEAILPDLAQIVGTVGASSHLTT